MLSSFRLLACYLIVTNGLAWCLSVEDTKLVLLQVLFRHGDRSPISAYPNDPYNVTMWSQYGGFGQLTQLGMRQTHQYGKFLRTHYANFLTERYDRGKVIVHSTDYDRTLMSAQSVLSGLFQPSGDQVWNDEIKWQPVPVHTKNFENIFAELKCARRDAVAARYAESSEYKSFMNKFKDLAELVNQKMGREDGFSIMTSIAFNSHIYKSHNLTLPGWIEKNFDRFYELCDAAYTFSSQMELNKLGGGGVLYEMKENILKYLNSSSQLELILFSGHDSTVAPLSHLLTSSLPLKYPPYVSSVLIELRRSDKNFFIRFLYKNNSANEEIKLNPVLIDGCKDLLCPLDQFFDVIKSKVVSDFTKACEVQTQLSYTSYVLNPTFAAAALVVLMFGLCVALLAVRSLGRASGTKLTFAPLTRDQHRFERVNLMVGDMNDQMAEESVFDEPARMSQKLK